MSSLERRDRIRARFERERNALWQQYRFHWIAYWGLSDNERHITAAQGYGAQQEETGKLGIPLEDLVWYQITPKGTESGKLYVLCDTLSDSIWFETQRKKGKLDGLLSRFAQAAEK
jgi:hypothetical protein